MSTATFMPFVAQENTTSTHQGKLMTPAQGNRTFGKTFSSSSATPAVCKALDVRASVKPTLQNSNFGKQMPVFSDSLVTTNEQSEPTTRGYDPDDSSDLWPLDMQPLTYLPDTVASPPSLLFSRECDSESDESLDMEFDLSLGDEWIKRHMDMYKDFSADVEQTPYDSYVCPFPPLTDKEPEFSCESDDDFSADEEQTLDDSSVCPLPPLTDKEPEFLCESEDGEEEG